MSKSDTLQQVKELLEIIKHKVDMLEVGQTAQSAQLTMVRDQLSVMGSKLDSHTSSLMSIESTLAGYADAYRDSTFRSISNSKINF